jgi:hypothetical protein
VTEIIDLRKHDRADGLLVGNCIETPTYVKNDDECQHLFDTLNKKDAVLVGSRSCCGGIITAMGVLRYLYQATSPFLLLAEIELSLRELIELMVERDELELFTRASLANRYESGKIPTTLADMTLHDYLLLIVHGENWGRFNRIFLEDRVVAQAKLKNLCELRNSIFHFRRGLAESDRVLLNSSRDWMLRLIARARDLEEL